MVRFIPETNRGMSRLEKVQAQVDLLLQQQNYEKMSSGKSLIRELDKQVADVTRLQAEWNAHSKPD